MKKILTVIFSISCILVLIVYLQYGRKIQAYSSVTESSDTGYCENVQIIANKLYIRNKEDFAKQIIQDCIDNTLNGIKFSYDLQGYPNELNITVYMDSYSYQRNAISFEISYFQSLKNNYQYNIKDNPEKFILKIEK